jgi:hypothetical protein
MTEYPLSATNERRQGARWNLLFPDAEECTDIAVMRNLNDDTLPELRVLDSLARK